MKKAISAALSVVALASTIMIQPQPASAANDIERFLGRIIGGSTGLGLSANQSQIQANVQNGLANLQAQVTTGINAGTLTASEAASINAEIARVSSLHNTFMLNGYTNDEVNQILSSFTNLNAMVASAISNGVNSTTASSTYPYYGAYNGYNGYNGFNGNRSWRFNDYNSVVSLQNSIQTRINSAVANGTISVAEASELRREYNQIARQINRRAVNGNLNTNPVVRRLSNLDMRLNQMINDNAYAGSGWWY